VASYRVLIKRSAVRELEAVQTKEKDRARLAERIQGLGAMPRPVGCEKLSGGDRYRVRQADYRIIYSVDDPQRVVRVIKIGHRSEVYQ